jgi:signal-transduction protein with cAMP-binding, CBS, and nucleotidyltransferase domain
VDLKKGGLMPIFTGARVLALRHGIAERSTRDRLAGVQALGIGAASDYDSIIEGQEALLDAVLEQQVEDAARGVSLSPRVIVDRLPAKERAELRTAVKAVDTMLGILGEGRL